MKTSIIMPMFNEENNIAPVLEELLITLSLENISGEIILVDDGSTDSTLKRVESFLPNDNIHIYSHETNLGIAKTLRTGFNHANGNIIIKVDSDGQTDPKYIPAFIEEIHSGADFVIGKRNSKLNTFGRRQLSNLYNFTLRATLHMPFKDYNSMYMAITKQCLNNINFSDEEINKYNGLHRYLVPLAHINGFNVKEIPVDARERLSGNTSITIKKDAPGIIMDHVLFLTEHYEDIKLAWRKIPEYIPFSQD